MDREKSVRNVLLAVALLLGVFLIMKMVPNIVLVKSVRVTLTRNRDAITTLTNARNTDFSLIFRVSRIDFPEGTELTHPDRGPLGFQNDFFLDIDTVMNIKKEGSYIFSVASDDGFQLLINENPIGEFVGNRPFTTNMFTVYLKEGPSPFRLNYFQGFGRLGLQVTYQYLGDSRSYWVGQDSSHIRFLKIDQ